MKLTIIAILLFGSSAFAEGITFTKDVRPIISRACTSCHSNSKTGLPNLLDYQTAFQLRDTIVQRVSVERSMPYSGRITESERDLIEQWVLTGAKK